MIGHALGWFVAQIEGNALWSVTAVALALIFRRPLERWWDRLRARAQEETHGALADLHRELAGLKSTAEHTRQTADAAHRIAADTHEQMTGIRHPDAPARRP